MSQLELIETVDLVEELLNRCDIGAVVFMKIGVQDNTNLYIRRWKGNTHTVMGLLTDMQMKAMLYFEEVEESDAEEDEL